MSFEDHFHERETTISKFKLNYALVAQLDKISKLKFCVGARSLQTSLLSPLLD